MSNATKAVVAVKRRCLESSNNIDNDSISLLLTLNDHCILKIFEYLELSQLCVVTKTCKKLQELVKIFFRQTYQNKIMCEVRISVTSYGEVFLLPEDAYVTHFLKFMQNLTICGEFVKRPLDVVKFIRNECNENLSNISFERIKFHKLLGGLLNAWLSTVDGLEFYSCENLHEVLRYCSNLKYLKIDQYSKDKSNLWMDRRYPGLLHLQYDITLPIRKLIKFLIKNPNVKSLMLKLDNNRPSFNQALMHELGRIYLEELFVTIDFQIDLEFMKEEIQTICNQINFNRLEIALNGTGKWNTPPSSLNILKELNHLHGLHILRCDIPFPSDLTFNQLKVLQLAYVPNQISTVDLSKNLPNLEELYLMFLSENFQELISPFARYAVKLKKIVARDFKIPNRMNMTNVRLAEYFNDERVQLVDACRMLIFIGNDVFDESFDKTVPKFPLVDIRRVQFHSKGASYTKPFVRDYEF